MVGLGQPLELFCEEALVHGSRDVVNVVLELGQTLRVAYPALQDLPRHTADRDVAGVRRLPAKGRVVQELAREAQCSARVQALCLPCALLVAPQLPCRLVCRVPQRGGVPEHEAVDRAKVVFPVARGCTLSLERGIARGALVSQRCALKLREAVGIECSPPLPLAGRVDCLPRTDAEVAAESVGVRLQAAAIRPRRNLKAESREAGL
eukprot:2660847-Prymnesium_polylepis.1